MARETSLPLFFLVTLILSGCSTFVTKDADLSKAPDGVRIMPPKIFLFVDVGKAESNVVFFPDYQKAYDVKPLTVLAKQDFKIELDNGYQLKTLTSNQDSTALLTFLSGAAELGAKAAGVGVSGGLIKGTFGLPDGIYEYKQDGTFLKYEYQAASKTIKP